MAASALDVSWRARPRRAPASLPPDREWRAGLRALLGASCLVVVLCPQLPLAWAAKDDIPRELRLRAQALAASDARRFDKNLVAELTGQRDPALRREAARLIGRLANRKGISFLSRLSRDSQAEVREEVAVAAGRILPYLQTWRHYQRRLEMLLRQLLVDRDPRVRRAAAWGLGASELDNAGRLLVSRLRVEPDGEVRAALLRELWRTPAAAWLGVAAAALNDSDPQVRFAAVWSLARTEAEGAARPLRQAARDPDPRVRTVALEGATRGRGEALWEELCAALEDQDARVRVAALGGLAAALEEDTGCALAPDEGERIRSMLGRNDPELVHQRVMAIRLAGAAGLGQETLWKMVRSQEEWLAAEALIALARQNASGVEDVVATWLADEDLQRRRAAIPALRFLPEGGALLAFSLKDPAAVVRVAALAQVGQAESGSLLEVVKGLLADPDPVVRAAAVEACGRLDAPLELAEALALLAKEEGEGVTDAAVALLGVVAEIRSFAKETRKVLEREAEGSDPVRARAAWDALRVHGVKDPPPVIASTMRPQFYREVLEWAERAHWLEITTVRGAMIVQLDTANAPLTAYRIVGLAEEGFFNGLTIHRVVPNFVVQGGDPRGDGWGGPGFAMRDELCLLPYGPGATGMALSGPDTGGSQLFVTLTERPHLLGRYPRLGDVVAGLETASRLRQGDRILRVRSGEGTPPEAIPILYGRLDPSRLDDAVLGWREERESYVPRAELLETLSRAGLRYGLTVAMGTWCSDSREQVPRLQALLAALAADCPFEPPTLLGCDRSKQFEEALFPFGDVELVPTIVVTLEGTEIGRIVETPSSGSLEEDLVGILAPVEGWALPQP